jgi:hypothetical protein
MTVRIVATVPKLAARRGLAQQGSLRGGKGLVHQIRHGGNASKLRPLL